MRHVITQGVQSCRTRTEDKVGSGRRYEHEETHTAEVPALTVE